MPQAISLNVGINRVKSTVFSAEDLKRCEDDARSMFKIAANAGFESAWRNPDTDLPEPLLGDAATFDNVVGAIHNAAEKLKKVGGGVFLFTFAGHGTQKTLETGVAEPDGNDESVVLADHLLFDIVWKNDLWPSFGANARAIVIADCCRAGGAFTALDALRRSLARVKDFVMRVAETFGLRGPEPAVQSERVVRRLAPQEQEKELDAFKDFYDKQAALPPQGILVSRVLLSACGAREDAVELDHHGAFTQALLDVWNDGAFPGPKPEFNDNYIGFMDAIKSKFNDPNQHPQIRQEGQPDFTNQRPFSIVSPN
jgi:Caspase domain